MPVGYSLLLPRLAADPALARAFFRDLRLVFYAAAALPEAAWDQLGELAARYADHPVAVTTSWGLTETAPAATSAHFPSGRADCIGVPLPGTELKLAPAGDKHEVRVRGDNVTRGYFRRAGLTSAAFDEEGFYRTGHDGPFVAALGWLSPVAAAALAPGSAGQQSPSGQLISSAAVRAHLAASLATLNENAGSARRVARPRRHLSHRRLTRPGWLAGQRDSPLMAPKGFRGPC